MKLVLVDFDNTLTTKDSFIEFLKFESTWINFMLKSLSISPFYLLFKIKLISAKKMKEVVLKKFFNGVTKQYLIEKGIRFNETIIPNIINETIFLKLEDYVKQKNEVVIVSASLNLWLEPFAKQHNVKLICTQLNFLNNQFYGGIYGENCNREVKKKEILTKYNLTDYNEVVVIGNKGGDNEMFTLATSIKNRIIV